MDSIPLENLTQAKFAESLNTGFQVLIESADPVELRLVEVSAGPTVQGGGRFESFSLMFHGPGDRFLPQKTYSFTHSQIGRFALFIVPVGREGSLFKYQAVFNRLVKPS